MMSIEKVKKLISSEVTPLKQKNKSFEDKFSKLENSVDFYSKKYEELFQQHQNLKKNLSGISKDKESMNTEINTTKDGINKLEKTSQENCRRPR